MKQHRPSPPARVVMGTAVLALLFLSTLAPGCAKKEAPSRADAVQSFLAPTDVSKLRPEARAHLPGGGKSQIPGGNNAQPAAGTASK